MHPHLDQLIDLLLGEHAEARRDLDVDRGLDRRDTLTHLRHQPLVGSAHRGHDAELRRARGGRLLRGLHQ
jgi:hypothetical protein